jgi:hypothetical protein
MMLFGAGLQTPPMSPTAGLLPLQETCGQVPWLGQETGHNNDECLKNSEIPFSKSEVPCRKPQWSNPLP